MVEHWELGWIGRTTAFEVGETGDCRVKVVNEANEKKGGGVLCGVGLAWE